MLDLRKSLIERRMIELDPSLAEHYLRFNTYKTQRAARLTHVNELAEKMYKGLFRFGEVGFGVMNGKDILVNGQHVCYAVVKFGSAVPCTLERFGIKNERELSELFRQFEILPRSLKDMVSVEADSLKLTWPLWLSSLIVSAATLEVANQRKLGGPAGTATCNSSNYMSKDEKVALLGRYLEEGSFLSKIMLANKKKSFTRHLQRKSVVLVMMKTWRKDQGDAFTFWERVRDGENLTRKMPEMKLREFLIQTRRTVRPSAYVARNVSDHEYAYRCVSAWNAFRENRPTRIAYYHDKHIPKIK